MRKYLTVILLGCSLCSMALVPPRDPSRWSEWQALYEQYVQDMPVNNSTKRTPASKQVVGERQFIPRIPVIAVNFTDFTLLSPIEDIDSMFNAESWTKNGAVGSIRQYFYDQSSGEYNPQFDVFGPITLSSGFAAYGGSRSNVGKMMREVMDSIDAQIDFTEYDSNNDGTIDLVYVYFAGFAQNDPPSTDVMPASEQNNLVWPAYYPYVPGGDEGKRFDGKKLQYFEFSNELDGYLSEKDAYVVAGIGVSVHEFCHALGLPDLYATSSPAHNGKLSGNWDIMCHGPYNADLHAPAAFTAYERFYMGWLTPTLITEPDNYTLSDLTITNSAYLIAENDRHNLDGLNPDSVVFYLLENRQQGHDWDLDIPGSGMLLTRIHYVPSWWSGNKVNNTIDDLGVDIIEADGKTPSTDTADGFLGKPGDAFPYGGTEYLGIPDHAITDITMENGVVSFKYRGGKPVDPTADIQAVAGQPASKIIRDGQLLIYRDGCIYSVFGMRQN